METEPLARVPASLAAPSLYQPDAAGRPAIERTEVLRYLGYAGQDIDRALEERIGRAISDLGREVAPRGVRCVFPVDATGLDAQGAPCIRLAGTTVELAGRDIFRHLKDARYCALIAATLGVASERRLRLLASRSPLDATLADAACSAYIEAVVDEMDAETGRAAAAEGLTRNWRFSCGYGDCPLEAQDAIVSALDATRRLGLTVTDSHLLVPTKSVTAVIGLFEGDARASDSRPSCETCRLSDSCAFRARGTACYRSSNAGGTGTIP